MMHQSKFIAVGEAPAKATAATKPEWRQLPAVEVAQILDHDASIVEARTIAVNVIVMVLVLYLFNCRSLTRSMFAVGVFSNWWVIAGTAAMIAAQLLFTYAPIMNRLFQTAPISGEAWLHILSVALAAYAVVGVEKWIRRRWARARGVEERYHEPDASNIRRPS